MATERTIARDFHDLKKNIKSYSDGQVAITKEYDNNIGTFQVTISPNEGCFKEGEFDFQIVTDYNDPPKIFCKTAIHHPNINTITSYTGEVCINLTSDSRMKFIIEALVYLMYNPNFADPLCEVVSFSNFDREVANSITGGRVGDYLFPVNARYERLHPPANDEGESTEENAPANDEGESTEENVEGMVLIEKYFGIKQYILESILDDDDDDEGNGDIDDDDDEHDCYNHSSNEEDDEEDD